MNTTRTATVALALLVATVSCNQQTSPPPNPVIRFIDSTRSAGLDHSGLSYAAGAADFDRDGWIDLAISTHGSVQLFHNVEGRFKPFPVDFIPEDTHGLSWIDLDRDGWLDLVVAVGANRGFGNGNNQVYRNRQGSGFDLASDLPEGLLDPSGRGRCLIAHDVDGDGIQDVIVMNAYQEERWNRLVLSDGDGFVHAGETTGIRDIRAECVTSLNDPDLGTAFIAYGGGRDTGHAYLVDDQGAFRDVTEALGLQQQWRTLYSAVPGDVDGDGDLDLYQVHGHEYPPEVTRVDGGLGFRLVSSKRGDIPRFSFRFDGPFHVDLLIGFNRHSSMVYMGRDRINPTSPTWSVEPSDPRLEGEPAIDHDTDLGVFLWRSGSDEYTLAVVGDGQRIRGISGLFIGTGDISLTDVPAALISPRRSQPNRLMINKNDRFDDGTEAAGVGDDHSGRDAIFIDVENDGDLDLFLVNGGMAFANQPDVLFVNRGDGTFEDATTEAGLQGASVGRGSTVTSLDFDNDGDLDLFVTNGDGPPHGNEGPYMLWENRTEPMGNWVRVDLEGPAGNPFAIGAVVVAAFGKTRIAQQRASTSGRFSTGVPPLHFGVGDHAEVELVVSWPTGETSRTIAQANQRVVIRHP